MSLRQVTRPLLLLLCCGLVTLLLWGVSAFTAIDFSKANDAPLDVPYGERELPKRSTVMTVMHQFVKAHPYFRWLLSYRPIWRSVVPNSWRYPAAIVGYPTRFSVVEGSPLTIRFAGDVLFRGHHLQRLVVHDAVTHAPLRDTTFLAGEYPILAEDCYAFYGPGCQFSGEVTVASLPAGEYYIYLYDDTGDKSIPIYAAVSAKPTANHAIAFLFPELTWQAYNAEGGGSLYTIQRGRHAQYDRRNQFAVSLQRPIYGDLRRPLKYFINFPGSSMPFLRVLREHHHDYRTISSQQLHEDKHCLDGSKILIIAGHHEYWTLPMREAVDAFLARGGRIINFSGNLMWWRVNLLDDTVYIDRSNEKETHYPYEKTGYWHGPSVQLPEERTFGVSWRYGGYEITESLDDKQRIANQNFTLLQPDHPLFQGTGWHRLRTWGQEVQLIHREIDGLPLDDNNELLPEIVDDLPMTIFPLAYGYAYSYFTTPTKQGPLTGRLKTAMVTEVIRGKGRLINLSTMGYPFGLYHQDPTATQLFLNALAYFLEEG